MAKLNAIGRALMRRNIRFGLLQVGIDQRKVRVQEADPGDVEEDIDLAAQSSCLLLRNEIRIDRLLLFDFGMKVSLQQIR